MSRALDGGIAPDASKRQRLDQGAQVAAEIALPQIDGRYRISINTRDERYIRFVGKELPPALVGQVRAMQVLHP